MMIAAIPVAIGILAIASLPGWAALKGPQPLWRIAAGGFAGQAATLLVAALIARIVPGGLSVWSILAVAPLLAIGIRLARPAGRLGVEVEPSALIVPALAAILSLGIALAAMPSGAEGGAYHAWYNADFFKHLGHVQSLANFGMPARDIFGDGLPLAYYWLIYPLPALGALIHGDAQGALTAFIVVQSFAFWMVVHGLLREAGATPRWAALIGAAGLLGLSFDGALTLLATGFDLTRSAFGINIEDAGANLVYGSTLFRLNLYIPQHQFMLAGLLGWMMIGLDARETRAARLIACAPLVAAGAISTLFGAACLGAFGLAALLDPGRSIVARLRLILLVGAAALAVPLLLGVVDPSPSHGALASPIFTDPPSPHAPPMRLLLAVMGLPFALGALLLPGAIGIARSNPLANPSARIALVLGITGICAMLASTLILDNVSLVREIQLRASLLPAIALLIGCALLAGKPLSGALRATTAAMMLLGLATPLLDTIWHTGSRGHWVTVIPRDDARILAVLRERSAPDARVLQHPASPLLNGWGPDIWAPIFAGRIVPASERATDWNAASPRVAAARAVFTDASAPVPADVDWVYLSRALHAESYDRLVARLSAAPGWRRDACLPAACLFRRTPAPDA